MRRFSLALLVLLLLRCSDATPPLVPPEFVSAVIADVPHTYLHGVGSYDLRRTTDPGPISDGWYSYLSGPSLGNVQTFSTDDVHTGFVRVTSIDMVGRIIAGTFAFEAAATAGTSVLRVSQGAFRVPYN